MNAAAILPTHLAIPLSHRCLPGEVFGLCGPSNPLAATTVGVGKPLSLRTEPGAGYPLGVAAVGVRAGAGNATLPLTATATRAIIRLSHDALFDAATLLLVMHFMPDDGTKLELLRSPAARNRRLGGWRSWFAGDGSKRL